MNGDAIRRTADRIIEQLTYIQRTHGELSGNILTRPDSTWCDPPIPETKPAYRGFDVIGGFKFYHIWKPDGPGGSKGKTRFITEEESQKIPKACPDLQWRLIFSLCRYGGVRCPSEILALTWENVLWDSSRIIVTAPKTKRYKGHETRVIPMLSWHGSGILKPWLENTTCKRRMHTLKRQSFRSLRNWWPVQNPKRQRNPANWWPSRWPVRHAKW